MSKINSGLTTVSTTQPVTTVNTKTDVIVEEAKTNAAATEKPVKRKKKKIDKTYEQPRESVGLHVTDELDAAIERCKKRVQEIVNVCESRNQKYRDPEFDIGADPDTCLYGLEKPYDVLLDPPSSMRVCDIYEKPVFFESGATSSDVMQGNMGDCWFLSALTIVAGVSGLLEQICVARNEDIGVYGFIFFRDGCWVDVIIDDQLFVKVAPYEDLSEDQKELYDSDPDVYDATARKGSKILYYARARHPNETWVPLIEKAYAKFYGNWAYINGGFTMQGIEDLTGGVSRQISTRDILNKDRLWAQLSDPEQKWLIGCTWVEGGNVTQTSFSLVDRHAYGVLRAREYNGKRFLVVRNPWGNKTEWTGRWSDGSAEWTEEWRPALKVLEHEFGADGQFIMEYGEFLRRWKTLDLTRLFDKTWISSSLWVYLPGKEIGSIPSWGDVSYTITVEEPSDAVVALQIADSASFKEINGFNRYDVEFAIFKKGEANRVASSTSSLRYWRSQSTEMKLEKGEYVVHVRIACSKQREESYFEDGKKGDWDAEKLDILVSRRTEAYSKALNYIPPETDDIVPTALSSLAGADITELEIKAVATKREEVQRKRTLIKSRGASASAVATLDSIAKSADSPATVTAPAPTPSDAKEESDSEEEEEESSSEEEAEKKEETKKEGDADKADAPKEDAAKTEQVATAETKPVPADLPHTGYTCNQCMKGPIVGPRYHCLSPECDDYDLCRECFNKKEHNQSHEMKVTCVPAGTLHIGTKCSTCSMSPIVGTLYRCQESECPVPALCENCFRSNTTHDEDHIVQVIRKPLGHGQEEDEAPAAHSGIECQGCFMNPIVGTRYKCMSATCPTYNLCDDCMKKGGVHDANHRMMPLRTPEEAAYLSAESTSGSPVVLGLRVYTKNTCKVTLASQLKHASLVDQ